MSETPTKKRKISQLRMIPLLDEVSTLEGREEIIKRYLELLKEETRLKSRLAAVSQEISQKKALYPQLFASLRAFIQVGAPLTPKVHQKRPKKSKEEKELEKLEGELSSSQNSQEKKVEFSDLAGSNNNPPEIVKK
jgi:chromosome segregation ATPase